MTTTRQPEFDPSFSHKLCPLCGELGCEEHLEACRDHDGGSGGRRQPAKQTKKELRASEVTSLSQGDRMVSASGVGIEVLKILVSDLHLVHSMGRGASVYVEYAYDDDNGRKGVETVSLVNFLNNLHS